MINSSSSIHFPYYSFHNQHCYPNNNTCHYPVSYAHNTYQCNGCYYYYYRTQCHYITTIKTCVEVILDYFPYKPRMRDYPQHSLHLVVNVALTGKNSETTMTENVRNCLSNLVASFCICRVSSDHSKMIQHEFYCSVRLILPY